MIKTFPNSDELNFFAAEKFVEIANKAIEENGRSTVALAGGSTPKSLYQLLSSDNFKDQMDWTKVIFFFGDERNVLPGDAESNFRMANENLFLPLHISVENVFRWQTELRNTEKIAENYEDSAKVFFALNDDELPRFDLILLGIGGDGHTASLFPFTEALNEKEIIAVANPIEQLDTTRLTLTFPVINNAANVIFLVKGADKAETLKTVLEGKLQPEKFPAQSIKPENGELFWLVDEQAAALLKRV
ncbi:MAG: 6-phosphogluconolactonase [Acidobacteriota bacterium]|nr:6-phosphogluconolactonase [Acidobacteriota bacterium]